MYVAGVDLGTSGMNITVVDRSGKIVRSVNSYYETISLQRGFSEQNPYNWISAFEQCISQLVEESVDISSIESLAITGQMHSLVLMDSKHEVVRNAILWNDTRTKNQSENINLCHKKILDITNNRSFEGLTLPKIAWVQENEIENWNRTSKILLPKDFLNYYLTGEYATDPSDASGTLLIDYEKETWNQEILGIYNIKKNVLPKIVKSGQLIGVIRREIAITNGLSRKLKIYMGGADNACGMLGAGIYKKGQALCSIGTSGVIAKISEKKTQVNSYPLHNFKHVVDTHYLMGVTLSAGASLDWYHKNFYSDKTISEMIEDVKELPISKYDPIFTPYLVGERMPYSDGLVRGSFTHIDINHGREYFAKAVLEGIVFSLNECLELVGTIDELISVGGGAKSPYWLQMQSDVFGRTISTLENEQGPAIGAAMLAAIGTGWYSSVKECVNSFVKKGKQYVPNLERYQQYQILYKQYKEVYERTK